MQMYIVLRRLAVSALEISLETFFLFLEKSQFNLTHSVREPADHKVLVLQRQHQCAESVTALDITIRICSNDLHIYISYTVQCHYMIFSFMILHYVVYHYNSTLLYYVKSCIWNKQ
jgi:hypothetical protein